MVPVKSSIGLISSKISKPRLLRNVLVSGLPGRRDAAEPALVPEQPVKRLRLQGKEAGNLEGFLDAGE